MQSLSDYIQIKESKTNPAELRYQPVSKAITKLKRKVPAFSKKAAKVFDLLNWSYGGNIPTDKNIENSLNELLIDLKKMSINLEGDSCSCGIGRLLVSLEIIDDCLEGKIAVELDETVYL